MVSVTVVSVPVLEDDTRETLAVRILEQEHLAYPEAVGIVLDGGWTVDGRRFRRAPAGSGAERFLVGRSDLLARWSKRPSWS